MIPPGSWKVHIENQWHSMTVNVWVYQRQGEAGSDLLSPDLKTVTRVGLGEQMPDPTLRLPLDVAEPLAAALSDVLPPDRAQGRHLDDAIAVRDRLLTIVESSARSAVAGSDREGGDEQ